MNYNELLFDKIKEVIFKNPATDEVELRLTQVKDGTISTTAEGEEIVDAYGSPITTLYNAKRATISATSALFSLDLTAAQFGSKKEVATSTKKIAMPIEQKIEAVGGKLTLKETPIEGSLKYVYKLETKQIAKTLKLGTGTAAADTFTLSGKEITLPSGSTGSYWVEYEYESETANKVVNRAASFPETHIVKMKCIFRNPCNDNEVYGGWIIAERGKINPESVEIGLNRTDGQPFEIVLNKAYCDEDEELFYIIVDMAED